MRTIFLAALVALACRPSVWAEPLTWAEAASLARKDNPALHAANAQLRAARAEIRSASGEYFPQITGNTGYTKSGASGGSPAQDQYAMSLTAQQELFSGYRTQASVQNARARVESAQSSLALTESQVFKELRTAFVSVLHAQENLVLLKRIRDRKEENRKLIELRFQGGRENRGAFLRVSAQFSQAQLEVRQAERALRTASRELARTLGRDELSFERIEGNLGVLVSSAVPDFGALALDTPDYLKARSDLAAARASLRQSRSSFFPSLSLSGSGRRQGREFPPDGDSWSVGASLSYPFFSGGRDAAQMEQAKESLVQAAANEESRRRQIAADLEDRFAGLLNAAGQAEVQKEFLEAAQERARIARAQYGNGLLSYQDWDLIENDLTQTEKQTLESLRRAALAEADWLALQGKGLNALQ